MTQTEQLIASLTAAPCDAFQVPRTLSYFDWSQAGDAPGETVMEVGDGRNAVQVPMEREDLISLQQRLTAYLIATA